MIKGIDISPRVVKVDTFGNYMKLLSSEAAQSIVVGAEKSFRKILRNFCARFFKPKR